MPTEIGMFHRVFNSVLKKEIDSSELNVLPLDPYLEKVYLKKAKIKTEAGAVALAEHRNNGINLLVGEGATLAGVAKYFVALWDPKPDWAKNLKPEQYEAIGLELFRFGTNVAFQARTDPTEDALNHYWANGVILPLPALLVLNLAGDPDKLVVNFSLFEQDVQGATRQTLARITVGALHDLNPFVYPFPFYKEGYVKGKKVMVPVSPPPPTDIAQHRADVFTEFNADVTSKSMLWSQRLRWNPYAAAVPIIHLLDKLDKTTADQQRMKLLQAIFDPTAAAISQHELDQIARTSAGMILLRAAFLASDGLPAAVDASRNRIAIALGIDPATDLRVCNPRLKEPPQAPPLEPPLPTSAKLSGKVKGRTYARSFLGRKVDMVWAEYHEWGGPSHAGTVYPGQYFAGLDQPNWTPNADCQLLKVIAKGTTQLSDDQLADRLRIINAIFESEGYADASRAADRALLSVGMQQFSFHVEKEGTLLYRRVRWLSDMWFDVFIRSAGLEVGAAPAGVNVDRLVERLQESTVEIAVPELDRPTASSAEVKDFRTPAWLIKLSADGQTNQWCVPGRVGNKTETVIGTDGKPKTETRRAFPKVKGELGKFHTDCHAAMGFNGALAGEFTEELCARWSVGAQLVPEFIQAQMELCVNRFVQLMDMRDTKWDSLFQDLNDKKITLEALFWSPAHAAGIIDIFINRPDSALPAARRAYDLVKNVWVDTLANPAGMDITDAQFRSRMLLAYLLERCFFENDKTSSKRGNPNDVSLARNGRIINRMEETTPDTKFGPRKLNWTDTFHW